MSARIDTLRRPLAEPWDWQLQARCRAAGSDTFFGSDAEAPRHRARRERDAKRICAGCPVQDECRSWAMIFDEDYGIWGGMTANERRRARHGTGRALLRVYAHS